MRATQPQIRYRAPAQRWGPEFRWVLEAAFGRDLPRECGVSAEALSAAADQFGLAPRIGARWNQQLRERQPELAALLRDRRREIAESCLRLDSGLDHLDDKLDELGVDALVLKGMALHRLGWLLPAGRRIADIDVLLDEEAAWELQRRLTAEGFAAPDSTTSTKHLPPLTSATWGVIEIHTHLQGVGLDAASTEWWNLKQHGLGPRFGRRLFAPDPALLGAHAVAHCWITEAHLISDRVFRMFADLVDISEASPDAAWWRKAQEWLPSLSMDEKSAIGGIMARWARTGQERESGAPHDLFNPETWEAAERAIADHALAMATDRNYKWSVRIRRLEAPTLSGTLANLRRLLWPSRAVLESLWRRPEPLPSRAALLVNWFSHTTRSATRFLWGRMRTGLALLKTKRT